MQNRKGFWQNMRKKQTWVASIFLIIVLGIVLTFYFFNARQVKAVTSSFIMDTVVTQQVYGKNAEEAAEEVIQKLTEFEQKYSMYLETSEIYRLNEAAGREAVALSPDVFSFLRRAAELSESSGGVFDITIAPLTTLWGITTGNTKVPDQVAIERAKSLVDIHSLVFDEENQTAYLQKSGQAVDLGGIAKGFSCGIAEKIYEKYGVTGALLSIGGNLYAYKEKPDGTEFKVGVRDPRGEENAYFASLNIQDTVVSTSGDYERYFEVDGVRYHHILDPDTGYPSRSGLISVTIITPDGTLAEFWSTTLFIQGKEALEKYRYRDDFGFIAVDSDFNIYVSENLREKVMITNENYLKIWD